MAQGIARLQVSLQIRLSGGIDGPVVPCTCGQEFILMVLEDNDEGTCVVFSGELLSPVHASRKHQASRDFRACLVS